LLPYSFGKPDLVCFGSLVPRMVYPALRGRSN
jgi:hypothetical protein